MGHGLGALFAGGIGLERLTAGGALRGWIRRVGPINAGSGSQYKGAAAGAAANFEHVEGAGHV